MKIENYDIRMMSETLKIKKDYKRVKLKIGLPSQTHTSHSSKDFIKNLADLFESFDIEEIKNIDSENLNIDNKDELKLRIIIAMLEKLTGRKIKVYKIKDIQNPEKIKKANQKIYNLNENSSSQQLEYEIIEKRIQYEKVSFTSKGIIKTNNGEKIKFEISFNVEKSSISENIFKFSNLKDPLVINYNGKIPELSDKTFSFDIDSDGNSEILPLLKKGNAFIAIDKNNNNKIDNGNELFGTKNNNGFAELKKYDQDNNNWIDENDPIFSKLLIWENDDSGNDRLFSLYDKNIGAIYLGNINTEYNLNDLGILRKTGIFLREDHSIGTIHHIDITI